MVIKENEKINSFLPISKNYVGVNDFEYPIVDDSLDGEVDSNKIEQSKDCLYDKLIYTLRHAKTGEHLHRNNFECLDEDTMLKELKGIKKLIEYDNKTPFLIISYIL